MLLYHIATKVKPQISAHIPLLCRYIVDDKIDTELRLTGNFKHHVDFHLFLIHF